MQQQRNSSKLSGRSKPMPKSSSAIPKHFVLFQLQANHMVGASLSFTMLAAAILLFLAAAPRHAAGGTEYTVGDAGGWTNGPNYLTWSQKYNFTAGDTLVFNYVQGQHDVYQVTEDAFRTCEPGRTKTLRAWVSGHDLVNLTAPGDYYYICNVEGHCLGGMKLAVSVAAAPPPPPPPPSPPVFLAPPQPPTGSAGRRLAWTEVVRIPCLAVIGMLLVG